MWLLYTGEREGVNISDRKCYAHGSFINPFTHALLAGAAMLRCLAADLQSSDYALQMLGSGPFFYLKRDQKCRQVALALLCSRPAAVANLPVARHCGCRCMFEPLCPSVSYTVVASHTHTYGHTSFSAAPCTTTQTPPTHSCTAPTNVLSCLDERAACIYIFSSDVGAFS